MCEVYECGLCETTGLTPEGVEVCDAIFDAGGEPSSEILAEYACPLCHGEACVTDLEIEAYRNLYVYD